MPLNVKICVSILTLIIVGGYGLYEYSFLNVFLGKLVILISIFMVLAIWLFPETPKKKINQ